MSQNLSVGNNLDEAVIEFAYQGPHLKLKNAKINFAITGDILFNIIRKNSKIEDGECYRNYLLEEGEVCALNGNYFSQKVFVYHVVLDL